MWRRTYQLQGLESSRVLCGEYVYKDLVSHTLGFMEYVPALAADSYVAEVSKG